MTEYNEQVKAIILSIVAHMREQEEIKEMIKDELVVLKENHDIDPKTAKKVAKLIYKANKQEEDNLEHKVDTLYEFVVKGTAV